MLRRRQHNRSSIKYVVNIMKKAFIKCYESTDEENSTEPRGLGSFLEVATLELILRKRKHESEM